MGWLSPGQPLTGHIGGSYSGVRVSFAQFEYPSRSLRQVHRNIVRRARLGNIDAGENAHRALLFITTG